MLARWLSVLGIYDFEIQHRPGNLHGNADGLSRRFRSCKRESCPDCIEKSPNTALEGSPSWTKPETGMRGPSSLGSIVHEGIEIGASTFEQRYCFCKAAGDNLACVVILFGGHFPIIQFYIYRDWSRRVSCWSER